MRHVRLRQYERSRRISDGYLTATRAPVDITRGHCFVLLTGKRGHAHSSGHCHPVFVFEVVSQLFANEKVEALLFSPHHAMAKGPSDKLVVPGDVALDQDTLHVVCLPL